MKSNHVLKALRIRIIWLRAIKRCNIISTKVEITGCASLQLKLETYYSRR